VVLSLPADNSLSPQFSPSQFLDSCPDLRGFLAHGGLLGGRHVGGLTHGHTDTRIIQEAILMTKPAVPKGKKKDAAKK